MYRSYFHFCLKVDALFQYLPLQNLFGMGHEYYTVHGYIRKSVSYPIVRHMLG